jgi:undecaprenyl-phosphate 4-deoxy-4-formamido-L-arabinose transferase
MIVSVVVPVYRSISTLELLHSRLEKALTGVVDFELVFVDDNSPDKSWSILERLSQQHSNVKAIQLMRNFGQHNALMCGFRHASGDVIVTIDDDLQQAPESIPTLLKCLEDTQADLVYGVYEKKMHADGRNLGSWLVNRFYRTVFRNAISVTSFRALRRELCTAILSYDLNFTYIDGLLAWNTQRIEMVTVPHHKRSTGSSGYTMSKLFTLAMNMFTNFSLIPLQCVTVLGFCAATAGLLLGAFYLCQAMVSNIVVPGYASTIVAVLALGGLQLLSLGIIGEYLGRLHLNVNRKPQYTVRRISDHSDSRTS